MASAITQVFSVLARQNAYANNILFRVASKLSREELEAAKSPSRESAYRLLVHLLSAEAYYLTQLRGGGRTISKEMMTSFGEIVRFAADHNDGFVDFVASLSDDDLTREVTIEFSDKSQFRYLVWQVLTQVFLHSAQHRGELSIVLSELGHPLPIDDIIARFAKESGQPWPYKSASS